MKILLILVCLGIVLILGACSKLRSIDALNSVVPKSGYALEQNVAYGKNARQTLDIYQSKQAGTKADKPLIYFIYGGAWREGDKADYRFIAQAFTSKGYDVVIPDYRLYPDVEYPAFIEDVADAIAFVEQNSEQLLQRQASKIVLMGHSAGAHTAALLATDAQYFKQRKLKAKLAGLVAISGPYDLPLDDPEVKPVFQTFQTEAELKPVRMVHVQMPAVLLLHGQKDKRVRPFHTENFAQALRKYGVAHQVRRYKNVGHVSIIASMALPLRALNNSYQDIIEFLEGL